jgi:hypothetical protein
MSNNYKSTLQSNNTGLSSNNLDLQNLIDQANALPEAGGEQATPEITVNNSTGLITAIAGTKSATKQLAFQAAKTITPGTTNQTAVAANTYVGGAITVKGDNNLIAGNIKKGTSIFGVAGNYEGEGGGGSSPSNPSVLRKEVNFYDYDGTLLYSYTVEEAQALTSLPPLPTQPGLICQGWNYDLATIKSYNRPVNVGATYITDDGKTRLYIRIAAEGRMDVPLYFSQTVSNGVAIDWGDGSATQTLSGTGNKNTTHTYAAIGDYVISLEVISGALGLGHNSSSYCIMGSTGTYGRVYCNMLQKVEIGNSVTSIGTSAFSTCYSLASVVIPNNVTSISANAFTTCNSLASVVIPNSVTSIGTSAFSICYSLASVVIPNSVTSIGASVFSTCHSLASVVIPNSVTSIGASAFIRSCYSLASVVIPNSVTSIGASTFSYCYGMAFYDFTSHTSVPTLTNTNAFDNIPSDCKIKVPAALYDEWIAATNWSTYASKIIAVSIEEERLEGDGQEFNTGAPSTLSFRSTEPLNEFQNVTVNGEIVDPANYELEEGSTIVKLKWDYLNTLPKGDYEVAIVSKNKTVKGGFNVNQPELNEYGFYYNQPYYFELYEEDILIKASLMLHNPQLGLNIVRMNSNFGELLQGVYIVDKNVIKIGDGTGEYFDFAAITDNKLHIIDYGVTATPGNNYYFAADNCYYYTYNEELDGYIVDTLIKGADYYGSIKPNVYGYNVVTIADGCFNSSTYNFKDFVIPDTITKIGQAAFAGCSNLTHLTLPDSVETIGEGAFADSGNLRSVQLSANLSNIPNQAFLECYRLDNVEIPKYVTSIGDSAFLGSWMTSIRISNSVTSIGAGAFSACAHLQSIYYDGTIAQWNEITKGENWNHTVPATHVQCSNGQVAL